MQAYIKNRSDFKTSKMIDVSSYEMCVASISDVASRCIVNGEYSGIENDFLIFDGSIFIIAACAPARGQTEIQCIDIVNLFDRDVIYESAGDHVEEWLAGIITDNYIDLTDTAYKMAYMTISYETETAFVVPDVEKNTFNVKEYIRKIQRLKSLILEYTVTGDTLEIDIVVKSIPTHNVDFAMDSYNLSAETYSKNNVAKITTITEGTATDYYLFDDDTYSTNPAAGTRVTGEWITLYLADSADPALKVAETFAKNSSSHLVEFYSEKKFGLLDKLTIRSKDRVLSSYVAAKIKRSGDNRYLYKSGELLTTASSKISSMSTQIEKITKTVTKLAATSSDGISIPPGMLFDWLSSSVPTGYLAADGAAVSRQTYTDLFDAIGTVYGIGDGSTTFNLPDTRGRVTVDYDASQAEFDAMGEKSGAKTHTLTAAQIPSLSIGVAYWFGAPVQGGEAYQLAGSKYGDTTLTANASGGGNAHNNLQPYIVTKKIIKY